MAQIVVRQLEDEVLEAVKTRAVANKRSTEAEVRAILADAVGLSSTTGVQVKQEPGSFRDFVGIAANRRTQDEIDSYVRALRDEWDR
ncbi:Arc family DNA-binding protein [Hoeflea sp. G2-23]|uniref:Arc family DNA-binding protein n=1 Tax=Hoeflea algicola TaxID=2983763 RepID=A0ABT3Z925_9HYPH|nr:Arc family DNA-binding protein [Hoeflea algicola]MCY0147771.1 Arc family DNA-binding protein [Hoeflea algicola]